MESFILPLVQDDITISNISITLPPAVFRNVTSQNVALLFTFYVRTTLFPVRKDPDDEFPSVRSPIVGASLNGFQVHSLPEPVLIELPLFVSKSALGIYKHTTVYAI